MNNDDTRDVTASSAADDAAPLAVWAPQDEQRKKRRRWPWIVAIPAVGLIAGLAITSTVLIAPGVSAAGVPIGGLTREAAAKTISDKLANTVVTVKTPEGSVNLTGTDLGASIDAGTLADDAHKNFPLWNLTGWSDEEVKGLVALDEGTAAEALKKATPTSYTDPVEATVKFDGKAFVATASANGTGIPLEPVREALQKALASDEKKVTLAVETAPIEPTLTTAEVKGAVDKLNGIVSTIGFYVGDERTVPVDPGTAASWLNYKIADDGTLTIAADEAAIAKVVPSLKQAIDRPAKDGKVITDSYGEVLQTLEEGQDGRTIGDTSKVAATFAAQLAEGNAKYELPVAVVKAKTTTLERSIDVNLSTQTVTVYENGQVVRSMLASTGTSAHPTHTGEFRVNSHVWEQNMGSCDSQGKFVPGGTFDYCTANVKTVMYFNGDEGFHGTWWHSNFGTPMSHGCVNLSEPDAYWLYEWTPEGTQVSVHY
ncbi:L,D-transpeptidase family protein [Microbacterium gorillae]|uniref:L,D-transpeptidase family protein n=1 Tax=Microbacterium gorillae TaxID=1231063 RepID=UPI0006949736|nr:L,D-transpeptidase family protein [Microbacterium gorillae]